MKRIILTYILLLGGIFASTVCAQHTLQSGAVVTESRIYRMRDSIRIEMLIDLTAMKVESNRSVMLIPRVETDEKTVELPAIEIMGRRQHLYYERNSRKGYAAAPYCCVKREKNGTPQTVDYRMALPYELGTERGQLTLAEDLCGCGVTSPGGLTPLDEALLAYTPALAYMAPQVEMEKHRTLSGEAYLDFVVNRTDIDPEYRRNPTELARIHATIDTVFNDKDYRIAGLTVKGYASPEGRYDRNAALAEGRTLALKEYLVGRYGFADSLFTVSFEPENWEGLRRYVTASNLADKEGILNLIDGDLEPDRKEQALRTRYPQVYHTLLVDCYPGLRRTDYRIDYVIRGFCVDEAKRILRTDPWKLSLKEMLAVAQTYTPGSPEFVEVFATAVRVYPEDELANLNMANALLSEGDAGSARLYLEKAGDAPEAENARGVAALLNGQYDKAERHFRRAADGGLDEARQNLRMVLGELNR